MRENGGKDFTRTIQLNMPHTKPVDIEFRDITLRVPQGFRSRGEFIIFFLLGEKSTERKKNNQMLSMKNIQTYNITYY